MNPLGISLVIATLLSKVEPNLAQVTCNTACTEGLFDTVDGNPNSTTCTDAISEQYTVCLECNVEFFGASVAALSQTNYDDYLILCADAGFKLDNLSVVGSFMPFGNTPSRSGGDGGPQVVTDGSVLLRASHFAVGWLAIGALSAALIQRIF
ncbi:hypothetical protein MSAN_01683700 [Mycena sanguinolenta]|uniref:Uncharacterized protein n=1 Tax=Mycena sanguinolenta TaxID=230812 RepID=A0A8H7CTA8_9AGAR|nr:hypothetical protein MSAN_01683700 [Mycena sanguinolenta]